MGQRLGEFEQLLLFALLRLGDVASGTAVMEAIQQRVGRTVSAGTIYTGFERLTGKVLVTSTFGPPSPRRGGASVVDSLAPGPPAPPRRSRAHPGRRRGGLPPAARAAQPRLRAPVVSPAGVRVGLGIVNVARSATRRSPWATQGRRVHENAARRHAYAVRGLAAALGFAVVTVITLALDIGANTPVFTVDNTVLLGEAHVSEADRVVRVYTSGSSGSP